MIDTKLKALHRDLTFWLMLAISAPGIFAIYDAAIEAIREGAFDQASFTTAALASPIVAYLLARQYPRGKAVEAAAVADAAASTMPQPFVITPPRQLTAAERDELEQELRAAYGGLAPDETIDEPADGFGEVSTGGAHDAVNVEAEKIDAAAVEAPEGDR